MPAVAATQDSAADIAPRLSAIKAERKHSPGGLVEQNQPHDIRGEVRDGRRRQRVTPYLLIGQWVPRPKSLIGLLGI